MNADTAAWLEHLPPALAAHRDILSRLTDAVERDPQWSLLELSCSVARGAGDVDSDLDLGLGAADAAWPQALLDVPPLVTSIETVIGLLQHTIPEWGAVPHQRVFVQYASGVQLDLVVFPASRRNKGRPPDAVVLHDPDGRLTHIWQPPAQDADAGAVREWAFLGWVALADLGKYLRRGSLWEALERLHQARTQVWRLWAVTQGVSYPAFGLTSVLDSAEVELPPEIEATVAPLDREALLHAAHVCARFLDRIGSRAARRVGAELPTELALFVQRRLSSLDAR